jgi:hypothetical protein
MSRGRIYRIVKFVEHELTAFGVSRLIMLTGDPLRSYTATTEDNEEILARLLSTLSQVLSPEQMAALEHHLQSD